jgi:hypothetical protein
MVFMKFSKKLMRIWCLWQHKFCQDLKNCTSHTPNPQLVKNSLTEGQTFDEETVEDEWLTTDVFLS